MPIDLIWLLTIVCGVSVAGVIATLVLRRKRRRSALVEDKRSQVTSWENEGGALPTPPAESTSR